MLLLLLLLLLLLIYHPHRTPHTTHPRARAGLGAPGSPERRQAALSSSCFCSCHS
jgi:hypothetical protein